MTICLAPSVSMRLAPDGAVHTCGPNWEHPLGNVAHQSLKEIWHGSAADALRRAVAAADYSLGCRDCAVDAANGVRALSHAATYDHWNPLPDAAWPLRIEFALSNRCNLQCLQCNGELSSTIRKVREGRPPLRSPYGDAFFDEIREFLPHLQLATFIGGEPFLSPEAYRVWDMLLELDHRPEVQVTTNGTIWNERVEHYIRALEMHVSVSIDGMTAETNDHLRVGADFHQVRAFRDRVLQITAEHGGSVITNFCLMRQTWQDLVPYMLESEELGTVAYPTRVVHPSSFSLFSLPADELRVVVDTWQAADAEMLERLDLNRSIWIETLASYRNHLDALDEPTAVPVELLKPSRERDRSAIDHWSRTLAEWADRPSLRIEVIGGSVTGVEVPDWAADWEPDAWIGLEVGGLLPVFEAAIGSALGPPEVIESGDTNVWAFHPTDLDGTELRVAFVPWQDVRLRGLDVAFNATSVVTAG